MKNRALILSIAVPLAVAVPILATRPWTPPPPPPPEPPPAPAVRWTPAEPVQGTIFRIHVEASDSVGIEAVAAEFAGEPLHFEPRNDGPGTGEEAPPATTPQGWAVSSAVDDGSVDAPRAWTALAAIPIDAEGALPLPLDLEYANGARTRILVEVPVAAGEYRHERLTVAPRYGSPPDSATRARTARESARARAVSRASHDTPRLWEGPFVRPRPSRITSGFGHGRVFNGQIQSRHMGTDFAGAVGAPVLAAGRGVVRLVDEFHLGGRVIYIDHGAGLVTAYLHLSEQEVAEGDTVQAGQRIGRVGATGRVTGPHLHWIVRYGTTSVDPMSLLEVNDG